MIRDPLPDGWAFPAEFLDDPSKLPPYVDRIDCPGIGPSRRPSESDLRACLSKVRRPLPMHAITLDGCYAIHDDAARKRNRLFGPAYLTLTEEELNRHLLLVGTPGAGKTTQGILPLVASMIGDKGRSVVVFDPKGDLYGTIRRIARAAGRSPRRILRLNLSDPAGSIGCNLIPADISLSRAFEYAAPLVMASEGKGSRDSPYWRNNSIELIARMLRGMALDPFETPSLPRVAEVLALPRTVLSKWLRLHGCDGFADFLESGSHNAETSLVDTRLRLLPMLDTDLCAVLSHSELDIPGIFRRPTVLVVEMDETRVERLRPIFSLLVQRILDAGIEAASRHPDSRLRFPVSVVIDEFGSAIGALPRCETYLNTLRSRRIGIVAAVQSTDQIHGLYRHDARTVLAAFSSKWFFPNVELVDAEYASERSGTMAVRLPGEIGGFLQRRVYYPEEIRRPTRHDVLGCPITMLPADHPPMQVFLTPSYRLDRLREPLEAERRRRRRPRRKKPLTYEPRGAFPVAEESVEERCKANEELQEKIRQLVKKRRDRRDDPPASESGDGQEDLPF